MEWKTNYKKKFRIREAPTLSTDVDSRTSPPPPPPIDMEGGGGDGASNLEALSNSRALSMDAQKICLRDIYIHRHCDY